MKKLIVTLSILLLTSSAFAFTVTPDTSTFGTPPIVGDGVLGDGNTYLTIFNTDTGGQVFFGTYWNGAPTIPVEAQAVGNYVAMTGPWDGSCEYLNLLACEAFYSGSVDVIFTPFNVVAPVISTLTVTPNTKQADTYAQGTPYTSNDFYFSDYTGSTDGSLLIWSSQDNYTSSIGGIGLQYLPFYYPAIDLNVAGWNWEIPDYTLLVGHYKAIAISQADLVLGCNGSTFEECIAIATPLSNLVDFDITPPSVAGEVCTSGICTMVANASSSFMSTVGFTPAGGVKFAGENFIKPIIGGGLSLFTGLIKWIIVLAILSAIVYFAYRAFSTTGMKQRSKVVGGHNKSSIRQSVTRGSGSVIDRGIIGREIVRRDKGGILDRMGGSTTA